MQSSPRSTRLVRALTLAGLLAAVLLLARSRAAWRLQAAELERELPRAEARAGEAEALGSRAAEEAAERAEELARARHAAFLVHLAAAREALAELRLAEGARRLAAVPEEHLGWEWSHLDLRLELALRTYDLGGSDLTALAVSRDGEWLASGTSAGELRVWSTAGMDFEEPLLAAELEDELRALALGGGLLAAATWGGELRVYEVEGGRELFSETPENRPLSLALLADGALAVGFEGGALGLREADGSWSALAAHEDDVGVLAVSADGRRLASGGDDGLVLLHGGARFELARALRSHADWVRALAFDARGEWLASGADDGRIALWEVASGRRRELLEPRSGGLRCVAFAGEGLTYVTDEARGRLARGHDVRALELELDERELGGCVAFTRAGESFVALARGSELELVSFEAPRAHARLALSDNAVRAVAQSAGGQWIGVGTLAGEVFLLDAESGEVARRWALEEGVQCLDFSADGAVLAVGTRKGTVLAWSVEDGRERARWSEPRAVSSLALDEAGERVLCVGWNGGAGLVDLVRGSELARAEPPRSLVLAAVAGAGARRYAWIGDAGTLRVWDAASGARVAALRDRELGRVEALAFAPDGTRLAAIASGTELTVYDLEAGAVLARGREEGQGLSVVAFDAGGERLLTAGLRGRVTIRDAASASALLTLEGDGVAVSAAAFSPDGARVLAGTSRGSLLIWESDPDALEALGGR